MSGVPRTSRAGRMRPHTELIEMEGTMTPTGSNSFKGDGRRSVKLNEGLDKRLESYAAAASAAEVGSRARSSGATKVMTRAATVVGAGLLLTGGPASARIVYTPANTPVGGTRSRGSG